MMMPGTATPSPHPQRPISKVKPAPIPPSAPALTNITFAARPGQFTAIVGISGSGKSTAASLLAGTLAGYRGSLTLNGVEVSDLSGETLAGAVTVIGASSHLFAGASARESSDGLAR